MPRPEGYWKERSRKRREQPASREQQKQWYKAWYQRHKDDPERKARQAANMRKYSQNPILRERQMARWILNRRVKTGQVTKEPCFCGETIVQAHHEDYAKPLDVEWLCRGHYREEHAKATKVQAQDMPQSYNGEQTDLQLAERKIDRLLAAGDALVNKMESAVGQGQAVNVWEEAKNL